MKYVINLVIILLILSACGTTQSQEVTLIDKVALQEMISDKADLVILDVRTADEVAGGFIENAVNIDWNGADFKSNVEQLDKSTPVVVYCMSGIRSAAASAYLVEAGFEKVYDLDGGYLSWSE